MKISDVKIRLTQKADSPVRAFASFLIDEAFAIHDVRVLESANGLFIAMPDRKRADGQYIDIAHPISKEVREQVTEAILSAYKAELSAADAEEDAAEDLAL